MKWRNARKQIATDYFVSNFTMHQDSHISSCRISHRTLLHMHGDILKCRSDQYARFPSFCLDNYREEASPKKIYQGYNTVSWCQWQKAVFAKQTEISLSIRETTYSEQRTQKCRVYTIQRCGGEQPPLDSIYPPIPSSMCETDLIFTKLTKVHYSTSMKVEALEIRLL